MSTRKIPALLFAVLIAIGTVFVAKTLMNESAAPQMAEVKAPVTYEILVAAKDLPAGTLLAETDVKWQIWPKEESKTENTSYAVKGTNEVTEYVGRVVRHGMHAGEPLTNDRTVKPGEQGFMAAALAPGMRAASIAITPVAGVAGFIFPGDHVDVIVTHQVGRKSEMESSERRVSETMLTNVRVLALDQKMNDQVTEPAVAQIATLEVSPKQAETLALAAQLGTVSLSLRSIANDPAVERKDAEAEAAEAEAKAEKHETVPPVDAAQLVNPALPPSLDTITWDSDVSQVLPRPANRTGAVQKIQIIRGKEVTESVFDLTQP
ncbi:MAG: Flp pilus assembly protein CpaB [Alphaproteobacteria bacterium]|jgi:pilus assembly protein CpaB|nr:Flp pilus assembly protein CpaB [Alphaproteobacteria bacterium]